MADKFKHRLGNLVLTVNNLALGRRSIGDKLQAPPPTHCYTHANATNSEKRIEQFSDGLTWKGENILRRELELLRFAANRWNLGCIGDAGSIDLPPEFTLISAGPIAVEGTDLVEGADEELAGDNPDDPEEASGNGVISI
jgi:hypothetical protein